MKSHTSLRAAPESCLRLLWPALCAIAFLVPAATCAWETGDELAVVFEREIEHPLDLPAAEQLHYAELLEMALARAGLTALPAQYFILVDRDPEVQAVLIYWKSEQGSFHFIGAAPCSTGRPGEFEHFVTPVGVFDHTIAHFDFRAEGTRNAYGIRGYGEKGMRVYDFGWVSAERGWGRGGESPMRLQMHATDPDVLESQLGCIHSKGCIRIPAALNVFIDRYGLLDADYERALAEGHRLWVLRSDRTPTPWSGRYLVVVDSQRTERPAWSRPPTPYPCRIDRRRVGAPLAAVNAAVRANSRCGPAALSAGAA